LRIIDCLRLQIKIRFIWIIDKKWRMNLKVCKQERRDIYEKICKRNKNNTIYIKLYCFPFIIDKMKKEKNQNKYRNIQNDK